ncbi:MAG: sterol desaturase family protein [Chloroflexi bacterium]|nr:sterol desaturase family protein [Chloroflexota bacterium]
MANVHLERDGLVDGMPRDERGYWRPEGVGAPNPWFTWPPKPRAAALWLKEYLWPYNLLFMVVAIVTWAYLTPEMSRMKEFRAGWIIEIFLRNQIMLISYATVLHVSMWTLKTQGYRYKLSLKWMGKSKKFLWNDQVRDNMFWSIASAGTIWTAFEVLLLWAYANGFVPYLDPREQPAAFVLILFLSPLWYNFYFYWGHRLLHTKFLYRAVHHVHHRNIEVGPWSGVSQHPIEHVVMYASMLIHPLIGAHPINMIFQGQQVTFGSITGHGGFEEIVVKDDFKISYGNYWHSLHHRFFECNYGEPTVPFDHLFGTNCDGSPEAREKMLARMRAMHSG